MGIRGDYEFSQLEKVTLPDSIEVIGAEAFEYTNIRRLVCPKNLTEIGSWAFYGTALQSVSFNEGLESIGFAAFQSTNIQEVVLPEGCVSGNAFNGSVTVHKKTTITLNANGGTVNGASTATLVQYEGEDYGNPSKLPTPVRAGYEFLGWYDYTDGIVGNKTTDDGETVRYHAVLIAKWCNHANTTLKNKKNATYTKEGYTGDTYCKNCGKCMELGTTIECKTLAAPKLSSVENVKTGLKIKWKKSADAKGYYVYRKQNGVYKKLATVKSGTSYTDTSVKNSTGTKYTYKVCAYYGSATSKLTSAGSQVRVAAVTVNSVKSNAKKTMTVKWKKVSKATGYQIQYTTDKNFTKKVTTKTIKSQSKTSAKIEKLSKGKKYYVRMRSYKTVNGKKYYSAWSKVKTVTSK